jgi:AcrR family transcriptional regulator
MESASPKPAGPKERLLEAVVDVAMATGIADKSLRAIAAAAGTSHRMLIHHFGSRERLLVEVIRAVEARERLLTAAMTGTPEEAGQRLWEHLRSPQLAAQERLFFEVYGQALQGREWATPLLEGVVEDWIAPVAAAFEAAGTTKATSRIVARISVAVTRGLLLDALAKGEDQDNQEVDAAMRFFQQMLFAYLSGAAHDTGRS